jgi:hypothetical protein
MKVDSVESVTLNRLIDIRSFFVERLQRVIGTGEKDTIAEQRKM